VLKKPAVGSFHSVIFKPLITYYRWVCVFR
jgi:hypothetical protein